MNSRMLAEHVSDDVLVRVLDGDATSAEGPLAKAHLDTCAVCTDRLDTLQRRTRLLTALLDATDPAMPALQPPALPAPVAAGARSGRQWLRAAAVVLLIAGGAVIASPARGRLVDWIRSIAARPESVAAPAAPISDPASIEFEYGGEDLLVELTNAGAGAELRFSTHARGVVAARVQDHAAGVDLMVLPGGLRIRGSDEHAAYVISVPTAVTRVHVRVGDGAPVVIRAGSLPCVLAIAADSGVAPCTSSRR